MELESQLILPYIPHDIKYGMDYRDIPSMDDVVVVKGVLQWRDMYKIFDYDFKPILTPLSIILDNYLTLPRNEWSLLHIGSHDYDMLEGHRTTMVSFGAIQKLYEYHIDFQGLIDKGLAIDGTTIAKFEIKKPSFKEYYG